MHATIPWSSLSRLNSLTHPTSVSYSHTYSHTYFYSFSYPCSTFYSYSYSYSYSNSYLQRFPNCIRNGNRRSRPQGISIHTQSAYLYNLPLPLPLPFPLPSPSLNQQTNFSSLNTPFFLFDYFFVLIGSRPSQTKEHSARLSFFDQRTKCRYAC